MAVKHVNRVPAVANAIDSAIGMDVRSDTERVVMSETLVDDLAIFTTSYEVPV
jgi:hypothetical protein